MHNEEGNAAIILDRLMDGIKKWRDEYEILAVDDNSTDGTPRILKDYSSRCAPIAVVTKRDNKGGMGEALMEGMRWSSGEAIVWLMGDLSDDVGKIPEIIEKIREGYDIVFASRYMRGASSGDLGRLKAFLSSRFTVLAALLFGIKTHDITNAFRGFRKELVDTIKLESSDFAISPELAIKAHLLGYKSGEIACSYKSRIAGETNFKMFRMVLKYLTLSKYRFYKRKDLTKWEKS